MTGRSWKRVGVVLALVVGSILCLQGSWIHIKAELAQILLQRAWDQSVADGEIHRPWPWADHWPVAALLLPGSDTPLIVLEGDSGAVLAFAPGHTPGTGLPGEGRTIVISGHRDTHFRELGELQSGGEIVLYTAAKNYRYRVVETSVHDARRVDIALDAHEDLLLVTCWPMDAVLSGGPLRFVVQAVPLSSDT